MRYVVDYVPVGVDAGHKERKTRYVLSIGKKKYGNYGALFFLLAHSQ